MDVDGEDIPPIFYDNLKQRILAKTPNKKQLRDGMLGVGGYIEEGRTLWGHWS